ncbi:hypothetical protein BDZ89DRAFT_563565 [Hymenopellis radicata]|nr:hypothetical protein BDZ89DRAFT_563565 [Hymenopellis radicata]
MGTVPSVVVRLLSTVRAPYCIDVFAIGGDQSLSIDRNLLNGSYNDTYRKVTSTALLEIVRPDVLTYRRVQNLGRILHTFECTAAPVDGNRTQLGFRKLCLQSSLTKFPVNTTLSRRFEQKSPYTGLNVLDCCEMSSQGLSSYAWKQLQS